MRKRRFSQFGYRSQRLDRLRWRFFDDPDPIGGNSADNQDVDPSNGGPDRTFESMSNATVDEPVAQPSVPTPSSASPRVPADPNQLAGVAQQATAQTANQWQSIRAAAEAQGFKFDQTVTDDMSALNFLLRQASVPRQASVYEQLGRQLAPKADQIRAYLSQQSQPQQPDRQPWEAPEFDERWAGLVEQDPGTGLYTAKQGVPHEIANKVNAYVEWKKNYDRNPAAVINGMVEARARAVASETFREQFAAQQRDIVISSIVQENSAWLYQVDASGRRARDYQGQFIPTPVGAAYLQQIQAVQQMGVTDPRQQDALAKQLVRGQYAQAYQAQALAAGNQAADPQTGQAHGAPNVNAAQTQPRSQRRVNPAATEPAEGGISLSERLRRDLAAEGVTDSDVFNSAGV